jgi:hypothetical protein
MEHELTSLVTISDSGGLLVAGVVTGLHPVLMVAGAAGGWWALTYIENMPGVASRVSRVMISSLVATWFAPFSTQILHNFYGGLGFSVDIVLEAAIGMLLGFLTFDVLGGSVMSIAKRWVSKWPMK